ncbi:DNA-binding MarR family transcriptional regulator [Okibacterium sp. HSC-33S16]|uniref:MarR family winged helix-turn-helix transcriptional regulator n=1 Tax=Okibacterium sp. HSC-33S16 TaxID=2910965 RepID=UPI00209F6A5E|nr:MarR family transcriptional regulator [Okibacterium sp. HSC-33S16]MCP2032135.1 DNA-binding MarR family transcriptional regulator [Okibacterium sp. HSC-33S16]
MSRRKAADLIASLHESQAAIAQALDQRKMDVFLSVDLSIQQIRMVILVASGQASTGGELARILGITAPTVSTAVDRLVEAGYLARDDSAEDRRIKHLTVTTKGQGIHDQLLGLREKADEFIAELEIDDLEALERGTVALRRAIERHRGIAEGFIEADSRDGGPPASSNHPT